MKIAMVLDEEFPPDPRVLNEAGSLIEAGHEVSLFCLDYANKPEYETISRIQVHRYKMPKVVYSISALAYTFPFYRWYLQKQLKNFFRKIDFDVVHVHDMRIAKTVLKVLKKNSKPKILDLHENRPEIMKHYEHVRQFPGNLLISPKQWKKWEKRLALMYDYLVVVTREAKDYLVSSYSIPEEKIIVFPNTVHSSFYTDYSINEAIINRLIKHFVIFYLGDTGRRRGLETAIKALVTLKDSIPDVLLVIAGKSKYDFQLKNLTDNLGLTEHVSFEGYQDMKNVPSYILASNICISPLHRNLHHDTTYANKIFQYMSFGVPVVVSDCTAQKNVVEQAGAGLIHRAEDEADFADKVLELHNNPEKLKQLGEKGKQFIRNRFKQEITSVEITNLYSKL